MRIAMGLRPWIVTLAAALLAGPAVAQSLGEVAAREREKRAKQAKPPPTYTNDDLKKVSRPGQTAPTEQPSTETPDESESAAQDAAWRQRADDARNRVAEAEAKVREIQQRIDALRLDRDPTRAMEPFRLQAIEAEIAQGLEALDAAKAEVTRARQALEGLQDEARRAGVPAGWLRER